MSVTIAGGNDMLATLFSSHIYLGLGTNSSNPTIAGTGFVEPSTEDNYNRIDLLNFMTAINNCSISNREPIFFPEDLNHDWGIITYIGLFSSSTGTDLKFYAALDEPVNIGRGRVAVFRAEQLSITIT